MINVNQLLQNSVRAELTGENLFTFKRKKNPRMWSFPEDGNLTLGNVMAEPEFALSGTLGISHETNIENPLTFRIFLNGEPLKFRPVRNLWTPAYMDTYYRCMPVGDYKRSGLIIVRERKCITDDDIFFSSVEIINDDNLTANLKVEILSTFEKLTDNFYKVSAVTLPRAMKRIYNIEGTFVYSSSIGGGVEISLPALEKTTFEIAAAYAPTNPNKALGKCNKILKTKDIIKQNEKRFNRWFEKNVPELRTSDLKLLKTYYYRFYLIKKNTFTPKKLIPEHEYRGLAFYESAVGSWYGCPVGLPVPMQVMEGNWLKDKKYSESQLSNWIGNGALREYIQFTPMAAWEYYLHTRDKKWLEKSYAGFKKYTDGSIWETDLEKLPKTRGSWPTGAEYQPSFYQHTPEPWDYRYDNRRNKEVGGRIKYLFRLDEIFYSVSNIKAMELMARELGLSDDENKYKECGNRRISLMKVNFWSEARGCFADMDCDTGKLCDEAICYDSFAPFMFGSVSGKGYAESIKTLLSEGVLGGGFPITSAEKHTPMFWVDNAVCGPAYASKSAPDFYGCCWNGPVWPYANTVALLGLGEAAKAEEILVTDWLDFFGKYTDLHYLLGDFSVPCIVEHYRYSDGTPFSVTFDYFHSCYIDLFMKYYAGITITERSVGFKPFTKDEFELLGVCIRGEYYDFRQYKENGRIKRKLTKR